MKGNRLRSEPLQDSESSFFFCDCGTEGVLGEWEDGMFFLSFWREGLHHATKWRETVRSPDQPAGERSRVFVDAAIFDIESGRCHHDLPDDCLLSVMRELRELRNENRRNPRP